VADGGISWSAHPPLFSNLSSVRSCMLTFD
jgi:hypothetical protein